MRGVAIECDCGEYCGGPRGTTIICRGCGTIWVVSLMKTDPNNVIPLPQGQNSSVA